MSCFKGFIYLCWCLALVSAITTIKEIKSEMLDGPLELNLTSKLETTNISKSSVTPGNGKPSKLQQALKIFTPAPMGLATAAAAAAGDDSSSLSASLMSQVVPTSATANTTNKLSTSLSSKNIQNNATAEREDGKPYGVTAYVTHFEDTTPKENISFIENTISTGNVNVTDATRLEESTTTNTLPTMVEALTSIRDKIDNTNEDTSAPTSENRNLNLEKLFKVISKGVSLDWFMYLNRGGIGINSGGSKFEIMEKSGEDMVKNL